MTRNNISKAIGDISDKYLVEALDGITDTMTDNLGEVYEKKTRKHLAFERKTSIAIASCIILILSVTDLAATGVLQGFFRDITKWDGTIIGTSYEQATDEISMDVTVNGEILTVIAAFANPGTVLYNEAEMLGIAAYQIIDDNRKTVKKGATESFEIINGQATLTIKLDNIDSGNYKLLVTALVAGKKADQLLDINGKWECVFTK